MPFAQAEHPDAMTEAPSAVSRNPATGEIIARYPFGDGQVIEATLAGAHDAFLAWRGQPISRRAELMAKLSQVLESDADRLAGLITDEMGKTLREARGEVLKLSLIHI